HPLPLHDALPIYVFGLLNVARAVLPHMRRAGRGHVVNISAIAGYFAFPGWGIYSATKFAVEGLTEAMAIDLGPLGIHATVVEPGFFRTNFLDPRSLVTTALSLPAHAKTVGAHRLFSPRVCKDRGRDTCRDGLSKP